MREIRSLRSRLILLAVGTACSGLLGSLFIQSGNASEQPKKDDVTMHRQRILPSQITLSNLTAFEAQTLRDLPTGTPRKDVEAYLTRWNIPYTFVGYGPIYGPDGNSFLAALKNIGRFNIFTADLEVWIHLDGDEKVRGVDFRVTYL